MADVPPSSSQDSLYDRYRITLDQENVDSSPPRPRGASISTTSPKRRTIAPTVTPRRFKKFFTPRNTFSSKGYRLGKSGRQLKDITRNGINRQPISQPFTNDLRFGADHDYLRSWSPKRRKLSLDIASSPPASSPIKGGVRTPRQSLDFEECFLSPAVSQVASPPAFPKISKPSPNPIRRLRQPGPSRRILERSFGGYDASSRGRRGPDNAGNVLAETSDFVTTPTDLHSFRPVSLPFCTTACNTNSLVAVGDEEGNVRLMDSSHASDFSINHIKFRAHHNAIMDIAFSSDDYLLATASGDQTSKIVDMHTQRTICVLRGHTATVKQVRFSPVSDSLIHSSSKDGTVQIWDLRDGSRSSISNIRVSLGLSREPHERAEPAPRYSRVVLDAFQGHKLASRPLMDESRPELSITAIHHMPNGREHLILTASEVNASIKLWDLRNVGRRTVIPLSSTIVPESHTRTRNYGINALVMSGDGGRLYAACRDATVYAYSTTQLALGCVPELSTQPSRRRTLAEPHVGAAPLYGFRHPSLRLGTFYIKAALRPARGDKRELLALGSTEKCAVLFSTDERYFSRREIPVKRDEDVFTDHAELPMMPTASSQSPISGFGSATPTTPIHQHGTALVRAHRHEVTSVAWTHDGDLVSISDDFSARCWREDAQKARYLRSCGESKGERWQSGWAEVGSTWDEEEI